MDNKLRVLERYRSDSLALKLLKRRLGESVYIRVGPKPVQVLNTTELLPYYKNPEQWKWGDTSGSGGICGSGSGFGAGDKIGFLWGGSGGHELEDESEFGYGHGAGIDAAYANGYGEGEGMGDLNGNGCGYKRGNPKVGW